MRNPPVTISDQTLAERLRAATELLEWIASDRERLDELPTEDRERLHRAVADFYNPDPVARRRKIKEAERERMATRSQRVGAVLQETGIRTLRRKPIFTTPNVFPPAEPGERFEPLPDVDPESCDTPHCYVCKQHYSVIHHFYDQLCPACAEFQLQQAN